MKYATISAVVRWSGGTAVLSAGKTTADDDHPLVVERPDLWTDEAPTPHLTGPARKSAEAAARQPAERPVETTSARPGASRNVGPR